MLHIKPREGLRVPNPDTGKPLQAEGAKVPATQYWRRRLIDGDVVPVTETHEPESSGRRSRKQKDEESTS